MPRISVSNLFQAIVICGVFASHAVFASESCLKTLAQKRLKISREISAQDFASLKIPEKNQGMKQEEPAARFGEFYEAQKNGARVSVWAIPYASGGACVVREVVKL